MKIYFFFIDAKTAKDGNKLGFAYANYKRSEWVEYDSDILSIGDLGGNINKGVDNYIYHNVAYTALKQYNNIDEDYALFICVENNSGCETKTAESFAKEEGAKPTSTTKMINRPYKTMTDVPEAWSKEDNTNVTDTSETPPETPPEEPVVDPSPEG